MLKKWAIFITALSLFTFMIPNAHAVTPLPSDYGAKGALQDSAITLDEALTYALQDEYLAQARYDVIIEKFGSIRPFIQIKTAEQRHISALLPLFQKYKITVPENTAKQYTSAPNTLKDAFQAGVDGEIDNIAMYDKLAAADLPSDVKTVFKRLGNASRNHLEAFKRGLSQTP